MTPGFWAITLSCDISTSLQIGIEKTNTKEAETITVKSEGRYQTGAGGNWMEVLSKAVDKYVEQVKTKFSGKY
jgi:hypothetical protein